MSTTLSFNKKVEAEIEVRIYDVDVDGLDIDFDAEVDSDGDIRIILDEASFETAAIEYLTSRKRDCTLRALLGLEE